MDVIIIGGHGKVALLAAPLLISAGNRVASVIRNSEQTADVRAVGANPIVADIESLSLIQLEQLLKGFDVVVWSAGAGGGDPERTFAVDRDAAIRTIDAAVAAGVPRFVMVSYITSGRDNIPDSNPFHYYAEAKAAADAHLRQANIDWTILAPGQLTLDEPTGKITVDDTLTSGPVSRGNVAHVIEQVVDAKTASRETVVFIDGDTPVETAVA